MTSFYENRRHAKKQRRLLLPPLTLHLPALLLTPPSLQLLLATRAVLALVPQPLPAAQVLVPVPVLVLVRVMRELASLASLLAAQEVVPEVVPERHHLELQLRA